MLKYSTDHNLFRREQTDTTRWALSNAWREVTKKDTEFTGHVVIRPVRYDLTKTILRKKVSV